jgi:hypothetical protein
MKTIPETIEKNRLIVLLPDHLAGNLELAYKIHGMAALEQRDVLYLTLLEDDQQRLSISRRMATMKAATCGELITVYSKLAFRGEWLATLQELYSPGDMVVCQSEQTVKTGFMRMVPIPVFIKENLHMPCRGFSGFYHPWKIQTRLWLFSLLFWLGCLVILGAFTFLEIRIDNDIQGIARMVLLLMAIVFEFGMLSIWSRLPRI